MESLLIAESRLIFLKKSDNPRQNNETEMPVPLHPSPPLVSMLKMYFLKEISRRTLTGVWEAAKSKCIKFSLNVNSRKY